MSHPEKEPLLLIIAFLFMCLFCIFQTIWYLDHIPKSVITHKEPYLIGTTWYQCKEVEVKK